MKRLVIVLMLFGFFAGLAPAAEPIVFGGLAKLYLTWIPPTTYTDAARTPIPAGATITYQVAITPVTVDLNGTNPPTPTSTSAATLTQTIAGDPTGAKWWDASPLFPSTRAEGVYRVWVRACDGSTYGAWTAIVDVQYSKQIPAAPSGGRWTVIYTLGS